MGNSQNPADMANKYGQIYIRTDSKSYFQGEIVKGNIFINIIQPYAGKNLILLIEGEEFCQWCKQKEKNEHLNKVRVEKCKKNGPKGSREIYSHKIAIYSFGDLQIPIGQWTFPFCFELDKDMPASFKYISPRIDSYIVYRMTAILETAEKKIVKNMEHSQELKISQIRDENYSPLSKNVSLEPKYVWFISRGNTQINAFLNKNNFTVGEEVILTCEIDNKQCKSEVNFIDLELKRGLELKSNRNHEKKKIFKLLSRRNVLSIPEHHKSIVVSTFKFKLSNEFYQNKFNLSMIPNTSIGKIVKNFYFIKLKIKFAGRLSTKTQPIKLPMLVYEKGYDEKFSPEIIERPKNWNPQIMPIKNVSMIDAVLVQRSEINLGYNYPMMDKDELWNDEKLQMMNK